MAQKGASALLPHALNPVKLRAKAGGAQGALVFYGETVGPLLDASYKGKHGGIAGEPYLPAL